MMLWCPLLYCTILYCLNTSRHFSISVNILATFHISYLKGLDSIIPYSAIMNYTSPLYYTVLTRISLLLKKNESVCFGGFLTSYLDLMHLFVEVPLFLVVTSLWRMMHAQGLFSNSTAEGGQVVRVALNQFTQVWWSVMFLEACSAHTPWHLVSDIFPYS